MKNNRLKKQVVLGIDIGGSHITLGLIDFQSGKIVHDFILRKHVDSKGTSEEILRGWCDAIKEMWKELNVENTPLGFAMPGPFDYTNGICLINGFDKYDALYGMDIRKELAVRLTIEGSDIAFRNDAEAFLEGEIIFGAAQGYNDVIGITLGTGMGSAYSHNGITADAELSITPYKDEIIEEFVSTRGLIRGYRNLSGTALKDVKSLAALYNTDMNAVNTFKNFAVDFAWVLELFIQKERPQMLVIGGNIANAWDLFMDDVIKKLSSSIPQLPEIVKATIGENAALIGGACCFLNDTKKGVQSIAGKL